MYGGPLVNRASLRKPTCNNLPDTLPWEEKAPKTNPLNIILGTMTYLTIKVGVGWVLHTLMRQNSPDLGMDKVL